MSEYSDILLYVTKITRKPDIYRSLCEDASFRQYAVGAEHSVKVPRRVVQN